MLSDKSAFIGVLKPDSPFVQVIGGSRCMPIARPNPALIPARYSTGTRFMRALFIPVGRLTPEHLLNLQRFIADTVGSDAEYETVRRAMMETGLFAVDPDHFQAVLQGTLKVPKAPK